MTKNIVQLIDAVPVERIGSFNVDLTEYEEAAANLQAQADRAVIDSQEAYATGGDLIKVARSHAAKAEDLRKELTTPLHQLKTFIDGQFKGPKSAFDKVRSTIEGKMKVWQRAEQERIRKEAEEERKRLEEEALARAEQEKGEDQDRVLEEAAVAGQTLVDDAKVGTQRGNYGSTGTRKVYRTEVLDTKQFLKSLIAMADAGEINDLGAIIEFRKSGLNKLAEFVLTKTSRKDMPGAKFIEDSSIRVY